MNYYTRAEWGAGKSKAPKWWWRKPTEIVVHHTGVDYPGLTPRQIMQRTRDFHVNTKGWTDIAYNFMLDPDGDLWEGRGLKHRPGATKGQNHRTMAVCVMGNYSEQFFSLQLQQSLATTIQAVKFTHHRINTVSAHSRWAATDCPGMNIRKYLADTVLV